jgi:hypothetical protein
VPRCDCSGGQCSCVVLAGSGTTVTGAGSSSNPYIISADPTLPARLRVVDTPTVDLTAVGNGTEDDPLVLSATATVSLDNLTNVTAPSPATGDTISWNGQEWVTGPPPVVPAGAVNVGPGLTGDGSVETPVAAAVSGVWGTPPLNVYGDDSTIGLAIYVDANGQLRADPRDTSGEVTWDEITGKPSAFPTTWDTVTGKPSAWPRTGAGSGLFTVASGWTLEWENGQRLGQVATVTIRVTRSGGTISSGSSGNITNTRIGTLTTVWQPFYQGALTTTTTGGLIAGYAQADGSVYLSATVPNRDITRGTSFALSGTWVCKG